jgi:hypothetical protein
VDVPATYSEVDEDDTCPSGGKLIDRANPEESWLLRKITGTHGDCGSGMPAAGSLTTGQQACLEGWIRSF